MIAEELKAALRLAREGKTDEAALRLRPLIAGRATRRKALAVLAYCHERAERYASALYLYGLALEAYPRNQPLIRQAELCARAARLAMRRAEARRPPRAFRTAGALAGMAGILAIAAATPGFARDLLAAAGLSLPASGFSRFWFWMGAGLCGLALALAGCWTARWIGWRKAFRLADGATYADPSLEECWQCRLKRAAAKQPCLFCGAPAKPSSEHSASSSAAALATAEEEGGAEDFDFAPDLDAGLMNAETLPYPADLADGEAPTVRIDRLPPA